MRPLLPSVAFSPVKKKNCSFCSPNVLFYLWARMLDVSRGVSVLMNVSASGFISWEMKIVGVKLPSGVHLTFIVETNV